MKNLKSNQAITLVALVITIIVLLILAGLTLTFVLGENGLFGKARKAKEENEKAQAIEDIELKILEVQTDAASEGKTATLEDLYNQFKNAADEYKITISAQTARITNDSIQTFEGTIEKLYVRNMKYNYVFEIGNNLQILNKPTTVAASGTSSNSSNTGGRRFKFFNLNTN